MNFVNQLSIVLKAIADELHRIENLPKAGLVEIDRTGEAVDVSSMWIWNFTIRRALRRTTRPKHAHVHRCRKDVLLIVERTYSVWASTMPALQAHTLYDWASMERHITEGRCPRLKQAAAQGRQLSEDVMQQVLQEEKISPPKPPTEKRPTWRRSRRPYPGSCVLECEAGATFASRSQEPSESTRHRCILCAQLVKVSGHMKTSLANHAQRSLGIDKSGCCSLAATKLCGLSFCRPCEFCDSNAKHGNTDSLRIMLQNAHPLFQVIGCTQTS